MHGQRVFTWDNFVDSFGREMRIAGEGYDGMVANGLKAGSLLRFDFTFVSDKKAKLEGLRDFILSDYPYSIESFEGTDEGWEFSGKSDDIAVTAATLMFWALDMAKRGYEFDARFDAYGASVDAKTPRFPDLSEAREDSGSIMRSISTTQASSAAHSSARRMSSPSTHATPMPGTQEQS